jgi:hypothetical protein
MKSWSESFAWKAEVRRIQAKRSTVGFYMTEDGPISHAEAHNRGLWPK